MLLSAMLLSAMFLNPTGIPYGLIVIVLAAIPLTIGVVWIWRITRPEDNGDRSTFRYRKRR